MTTTAAPQANLKVNINDRDYDYSELPQKAQLVLRDMMRIDQRMSELQFELRHLQAARQLYGSGVRQAIQEGEGMHDNASEQGGNGHHE